MRLRLQNQVTCLKLIGSALQRGGFSGVMKGTSKVVKEAAVSKEEVVSDAGSLDVIFPK